MLPLLFLAPLPPGVHRINNLSSVGIERLNVSYPTRRSN